MSNLNISPTDEQNAAIRSIVEWYGRKGEQESYLAGYAGSGKTSTVNVAVQEIRAKYKKCKKVKIAAYTGKAASVLRKKGNDSAQTIHSLIYKPKIDKETGRLKFLLSPDSDAADADLIILDECSMVDEKMANDLRSFGKKILIMGDPGQLPPVKGQGAFTAREPDNFLREIHRQAANSPILELATLARQGKKIPIGFESGNVKVLLLNKANGELIHNQNSQIICGLNKVRWTITQRIRQGLLYEGQRPVAGERLICCKNNPQEGLFNGIMGKLDAIRGEFEEVPGSIDMDFSEDGEEKSVKGLGVDPHHFDNHFHQGAAKKIEWFKGMPKLNEFDWGYAITAHKSQGSSWQNITVIDDSGSFREHQAKWLYTAITRAEESLTLLRREA